MSKIELFIQTHQKWRGKAWAASKDMNGHWAFKEVIVELKKHFEELWQHRHPRFCAEASIRIDVIWLLALANIHHVFNFMSVIMTCDDGNDDSFVL